jgi:hypothetical protein
MTILPATGVAAQPRRILSVGAPAGVGTVPTAPGLMLSWLQGRRRQPRPVKPLDRAAAAETPTAGSSVWGKVCGCAHC